nr:Toll-like receptor 7 [Altica viridicyanea]
MKVRLKLMVLFLLIYTEISETYNLDDNCLEFPNNDDGNYVPPLGFLGVDDGGCYCRRDPDIEGGTLCYGKGTCTQLPIKLNLTTHVVTIKNTHISRIEKGSFSNLKYTIVLKIEGNNDLTYIASGVFKENLEKLENLTISGNPNLKTLSKDTFDGLINLECLFLARNGFTKIYDIASALSPTILPKLAFLSLKDNNFIKILEHDFSPMKNTSLKALDLSLCGLKSIHPNFLSPFYNLNMLIIGENPFSIFVIVKVLQKLVNKVPLYILNLSSAGLTNDKLKELLPVVAKSNISELNLDKNPIYTIQSQTFPHMPNLITLRLGDCSISSIADDAFQNLTNLKYLKLNENQFSKVPKGALLPHLLELDLRHRSEPMTNYYTFDKGTFLQMKNLKCLNLKSNNIAHLFNYSLLGLNNLRYLNLGYCSLYQIPNRTFALLNELVYLNLESNQFTYNHELFQETFEGLFSIKILLLGRNFLSFSEHANPFSNLTTLRILSLAHNSIEVIPKSLFSNLINLERIDLSHNYIKVWSERIFITNRNLQTVLITYNNINSFNPVVLDDFSNLTTLALGYNAFTCDCQIYKVFTDYITKNNESKIYSVLQKGNLTCLITYNSNNQTNGKLLEYFDKVRNNLIDCDKTIALFLPLALFLLLIFSLSLFLIYLYRWHIRLWILLFKLYLVRHGIITYKQSEKPDISYEYDAFISYSNEDRHFVKGLVSMLEDYSPFLKLCVYERDFQAGTLIADSILTCITKSRKIVLVVSDNYAKSHWCRWESQIAENHRLFFQNSDGGPADDSLVVIKLGPVNKSHMTPMLKYLMKTRIYLSWCADPKKQKVFWHKLRAILATSKTESRVDEITHM